uniref:DUF6908 domain-containing protein n=2 Tax=Neptunomonas phycophila TaxID=1572645 RepID=UPI00355A3B7D
TPEASKEDEESVTVPLPTEALMPVTGNTISADIIHILKTISSEDDNNLLDALSLKPFDDITQILEYEQKNIMMVGKDFELSEIATLKPYLEESHRQKATELSALTQDLIDQIGIIPDGHVVKFDAASEIKKAIDNYSLNFTVIIEPDADTDIPTDRRLNADFIIKGASSSMISMYMTSGINEPDKFTDVLAEKGFPNRIEASSYEEAIQQAVNAFKSVAAPFIATPLHTETSAVTPPKPLDLTVDDLGLYVDAMRAHSEKDNKLINQSALVLENLANNKKLITYFDKPILQTDANIRSPYSPLIREEMFSQYKELLNSLAHMQDDFISRLPALPDGHQYSFDSPQKIAMRADMGIETSLSIHVNPIKEAQVPTDRQCRTEFRLIFSSFKPRMIMFLQSGQNLQSTAIDLLQDNDDRFISEDTFTAVFDKAVDVYTRISAPFRESTPSTQNSEEATAHTDYYHECLSNLDNSAYVLLKPSFQQLLRADDKIAPGEADLLISEAKRRNERALEANNSDLDVKPLPDQAPINDLFSTPEQQTPDTAIPNAIEGTQVGIDFSVGFSSVVRDADNNPHYVLANRNNRLQAAPIIDGKPYDIHAGSPTYLLNETAFYFQNEFYVNDEIIIKTPKEIKQQIDGSIGEAINYLKQLVIKNNEVSLKMAGDLLQINDTAKVIDAISIYEDYALATNESLNVLPETKLDSIAHKLGNTGKITGKSQLLKHILKSISSLNSRYNAMQTATSAKEQIKTLTGTQQPVPISLIIDDTTGRPVQNHVYTLGDIETGKALGLEVIPAINNRGDNEPFFNKAHALLTNPVQYLSDQQLLNNALVAEYVNQAEALNDTTLAKRQLSTVATELLDDIGLASGIDDRQFTEALLNNLADIKTATDTAQPTRKALASQGMLEAAEPVSTLHGEFTGWYALEIASDSLGLSGNGGVALINPNTMEMVDFPKGDRPHIEASIRATGYAIDNPIEVKATAKADLTDLSIQPLFERTELTSSTETSPFTSFVFDPSKAVSTEPVTETVKSSTVELRAFNGQQGQAEKNIAKLMHGLGFTDIPLHDDTGIYAVIKNDPYMDLTIESHPSLSSDNVDLFFTHYRQVNGDSVLDAELVLSLSPTGHLSLIDTATENPMRGGELRGINRSFGAMFSKNLLDQGFMEGEVIFPNNDPDHSSPSDTPTNPYKDKSASEIKALVDNLTQADALLVLSQWRGTEVDIDTALLLKSAITEGTDTLANVMTRRRGHSKFLDILNTQLKKDASNGITTVPENDSTQPDSPRDLATPHTTTDRNDSEDRPSNPMANDQRDNDSEENRVTRGRIHSTEPTTKRGELPRERQISRPEASVLGRNGDDSDQADITAIARDVSFNLRGITAEDSHKSNAQIASDFATAINTYITLRDDDRLPTHEEKQALVSFSGTAHPVVTEGLGNYVSARSGSYNIYLAAEQLRHKYPDTLKYLKSSTVDSYYTENEVVDFMWAALAKMGINAYADSNQPLNVLEPSVGNGRFIGLAPEYIRSKSNITAVEKDEFAAQITQWCYPEANVMQTGYENALIYTNSQDVVIGNPPYGDVSLYDRKDKKNRMIHDFFLKTSIDQLKPGGVLAFVTSSGTLDKTNSSLREKIYESADLVSAFRLPDSAFSNTGAKVVTDVLFFHKRHPEEAPKNANWLKTDLPLAHNIQPMGMNELQEIPMNQYYIDNPDHILGELQQGTNRFGWVNRVTGEVPDLVPYLDKVPDNIFSANTAPVADQTFDTDIPAKFANQRMGSYVVENDDIYTIQATGLVETNYTGARKTKAIMQIAIRDAMANLIEATINQDDDAAQLLMAEMNTAYDAYTAKYGYLGESRNKRILARDPLHYTLLALERTDPVSKVVIKSDLFSQISSVNRDIKKTVETVADAIAIQLNTTGKVTTSQTALLLRNDEDGRFTEADQESVAQQLEAHCFIDPVTGEWEIASTYLSGNIYEKIDLAKSAATTDPSFKRNIEALEEVTPSPIGIDDIHIRLGQAWVGSDIVELYVRDRLNATKHDNSIRIAYVPELHHWKIELTAAAKNRYNTQNTGDMASPALSFVELVNMTLNQKRALVRDQDGGIDIEQTTIAKAKQADILEDFSNYIRGNASFSSQVEEQYNRSINAHRIAEYKGEHLTFPGMSDTINGRPLKLRPHQPAITDRILSSPHGVLIAHEAGAGKTLEMISSAIEMKRLGLANKPVIVIPNHMLLQATNEARDLYPNAKILTATHEDFDHLGRHVFAQKANSNDLDVTIMTHSMFERLKVPNDFVQSFIQDELDELETVMTSTDSSDRISLRALESAKKKLESKLDTLIKKSEDKSDSIDFGECGFDAVFYDEAHYLKNYAPPTSLGSIAGVNTNTSSRAMDAVMKSDYIRHIRGDEKGFYPATGTPITNSISEMWVMMRLTAPKRSEERRVG